MQTKTGAAEWQSGGPGASVLLAGFGFWPGPKLGPTAGSGVASTRASVATSASDGVGDAHRQGRARRRPEALRRGRVARDRGSKSVRLDFDREPERRAHRSADWNEGSREGGVHVDDGAFRGAR